MLNRQQRSQIQNETKNKESQQGVHVRSMEPGWEEGDLSASIVAFLNLRCWLHTHSNLTLLNFFQQVSRRDLTSPLLKIMKRN